MKTENVFNGDLEIKSRDTKKYSYTRITGSLTIQSDAKLDALTSVGGNLSLNDNAKLDAPVLTSVGGNLSINADAKLDAPNAKYNVSDVPGMCRDRLIKSFASSGYSWADGILAKIVARRGNVSRVIVCGKTKVSYLVKRGDVYSHGETLGKAREGLLYKIGSRDTTPYKKWTLGHKCTKADAIKAYRIITGACEQGTMNWMEQHKVPESLTVSKVIKLTAGAYGSEVFKKFFVCHEKI